MIAVKRAAVIGLGLIGGSVARELASRRIQVSGFDADPEQLAAAVQSGVVEVPLESSLDGLRDVDVVILAVPVDSAVSLLRQIAPNVGGARLITDVGSTKGSIVAAASTLGLGARFVGSHPLAGDHRSGWVASRRDLFDGACVYLCPTSESSDESVNLAASIWRAFGGRPTILPADRHDLKLAWTSHLPHLVSNALALAMANNDVERGELGPGGRDVTRLAGSSPDMWAPIAEENAVELRRALLTVEKEIAELRNALSSSNGEELRARLVKAREWFREA